MSDYFRYFKFLVTHKLYVFAACYARGVIWRGIKHDMGKFRPKAFRAYSKRFAAGNSYDIDDLEYLYVFTEHLRRSEHHWQHWCYVQNSGEIRYLPMSDGARNEMLADLMGSSKQYGTSISKWYVEHEHEFHLHPDTKWWIRKQFGEHLEWDYFWLDKEAN